MLLGRAEECAVVDGVLGQARAGASGVLLVAGEPGVGKSRLGPAHRGTMVSLMGPRPGHGHAADAPRPVMRRADRRTDVSPGPAGEPGRPGWEQITAPGDRR